MTERTENLLLVVLGAIPLAVLSQVYGLAAHAILILGRHPLPHETPPNVSFTAHLKLAEFGLHFWPVAAISIVLAFVWLQREGVRVGMGLIVFVMTSVMALFVIDQDPGGSVAWFFSTGVLGPCRGA